MIAQLSVAHQHRRASHTQNGTQNYAKVLWKISMLLLVKKGAQNYVYKWAEFSHIHYIIVVFLAIDALFSEGTYQEGTN